MPDTNRLLLLIGTLLLGGLALLIGWILVIQLRVPRSGLAL